MVRNSLLASAPSPSGPSRSGSPPACTREAGKVRCARAAGPRATLTPRRRQVGVPAQAAVARRSHHPGDDAAAVTQAALRADGETPCPPHALLRSLRTQRARPRPGGARTARAAAGRATPERHPAEAVRHWRPAPRDAGAAPARLGPAALKNLGLRRLRLPLRRQTQCHRPRHLASARPANPRPLRAHSAPAAAAHHRPAPTRAVAALTLAGPPFTAPPTPARARLAAGARKHHFGHAPAALRSMGSYAPTLLPPRSSPGPHPETPFVAPIGRLPRR